MIGYLIALGRDDHHLLPPATHVLRVLPGAAAMLAVWMLLSLPPLAEAAIAGIVYVPLAFAFGAVPRELLDAVLRRGSKEAAA